VPAVDFALLQLEENPVYEGANTAITPYRLATDKLYMPVRSARLGPAPSHLDRADELRSILAAVPKLIETYAPDGAISERCYVHDLTWLLALAGFQGVHTSGDGIITDPDAATIPTGAHRWVFTKKSGITAQTAQMILNYADESVNLKGNGYGVSQLSLNADGELSADLMGLVLKRLAVDTTSVPVYASAVIPPVRRGDLFVTWLTSGGVISDFSFQIASSLERVRSLSLATPSSYPDLMEFGDDQVKLTGSIPKRVLAAADIDALLSATTFAAKARWKTPKVIGATAYTYSMWVEMPAAQLTGGSADELGNKRRHGGTYDFEAAYDETAGYDCKITLVNDVTAIATYV
jgi:hypothetical protein